MALTSSSSNGFSSLFASLKFGIKRTSRIELSPDSNNTMVVHSPSSKLRRQALSLDFTSAEHSKMLEELVQMESETKKIKNTFNNKRRSLTKKNSTVFNSNESLHNAVLNGNVELTRQVLLTENVEINAILPPGWSALHHACRLGNLRMIKLLFEFGADPSVPNNEGLTPLLIAVTNGYFDVAAYLINDGGVSCEEVRNGFQAYNNFTDVNKNKSLVVTRKSKSFDGE